VLVDRSKKVVERLVIGEQDGTKVDREDVVQLRDALPTGFRGQGDAGAVDQEAEAVGMVPVSVEHPGNTGVLVQVRRDRRDSAVVGLEL
jgi:hypothetical protein